ncbi:glutamine-hydrolyzing GMP synthase [Candidatus Kuenenbacteria bacterium RIFCSPHIGHO2_02_FULL_39_13]|uniref:GMP synthase [glutamine-hydrolyzing] n=1 Tax=Candidatus Kuenenbacteria bacterium RIFCSPHIGHO2_02_FULL_39_13 TaxID=1798561 RepID=A0A1F6FMC3_9BACT|nr:MAG: glutamine-hydrolyzing GMP synthase [Candidatus Kuenenbacteria bacterium RIFCSPHIGHO2_02_FULL_39_13]
MDKIIILDFGGQYCHLISRRIRDFGVCAEVMPSNTSSKVLQTDKTIKGIILSGGARSVYEKDAPKFDKEILNLLTPILGICYGHQLIAHLMGGKVVSEKFGEYGLMKLNIKNGEEILARLGKSKNVWMNHSDIVVRLPKSFMSIASTEHSKIAAYANNKQKIFGVQFHPEVSHTENGDQLLKNFVIDICQCKKSCTPTLVAQNLIKETREIIGNEKAIIGLSGGVDSSVAAALVEKAIGKKLIAVYVDTGLMRDGETKFIEETFRKKNLNLKVIRVEKQFFRALKGVSSPERKRKIIGRLFADIFRNIAKKERASFLIQGTIYSDRIESGLTQHSSKIKSHHNVGGLPKNLKMKLYEPLKDLYKDEVRKLAYDLDLPKKITIRQVFPGPGLAVRIIGKITPERVKIVRQAGKIIEEELRGTEFWKNIWMSFAVLLPIKSVGIQGDRRSYKYPIVVRVIESRDAMTANFSKIPFSILERISTRITNEIIEVNRVVYDITNKPPATMEWE